MTIRGRAANVVRGADRRVQALARFSPSIQRFLRVIVIVASVLILLVFLPLAGGLTFTALVLKEMPLAYSAMVALGVMAVLIVLVLRFKRKADATLGSITDLDSLTDFLFEGVFEALQEGVVGLGVVVILLGGAAAAGAHFLGHAWMLPVGLTLVGTGVIELALGSLVAFAFRRLVGERLRVKAKDAIRWANENGGVA